MFFQIDVTPKEKKRSKVSNVNDEEQLPRQELFELVLAPFQPQTRIKLDTTVYNSMKCSLSIKNPSNRNLSVTVSKMPPPERLVVLSTSEVAVHAESSSEIEISWTPQESGSWRDTLQLTDSRRIKYDVALITTAQGVKKAGKGRAQVLGPVNTNKSTVNRRISPPAARETKKNIHASNLSQLHVPNKRPRLNVQPSNKENAGKPGWIFEPSVDKPTNLSQNLTAHDFTAMTNSTKFNLTSLNTKACKDPIKPEIHVIPSSERDPITFAPKRLDISSLEVADPAILHRDTFVAVQQTNVAGAAREFSVMMDSTNFNFTPIKPACHGSHQQSEIISESGPKIKFSPQEAGIISPEIGELPSLRRETYVTSKKGKSITIQLSQHEADEDENFLDSLSPQLGTQHEKEEQKPSEFSVIINDMNFLTPKASLHPSSATNFSPNGCSTGNRTRSLGGKSASNEVSPMNLAGNNTFDISDHKAANNSEANGTYELPISPTGSKNSGSIRPTRLSRSFETTSFLTTDNFDEWKKQSVSVSWTPTSHDVCSSHSTSAGSPRSLYLKNYDDVSVKDVLEADLWVKSENEQYNTPSLITQRGLSSTLNRIEEETSPYEEILCKTVNIKKSSLRCDKTINFRRFDISPVKKHFSGVKSNPIRKISPTKSAKIQKKEKNGEPVASLRKKVQLNGSIKRGQVLIPGVRIANLSLAGLNRSTKDKSMKSEKKEVSIKLHDPNDFLTRFCNPDPFGATMTQDPFLTSTLYYDEKWMHHQEMEFKKWLNTLLTPPEHLDADVDTIRVDVGKVWQSCRAREDVALAETREAVSARYHTNTRLNTLRKAACAMFRQEEITTALSKATVCIERGTLMVREDRDLHRDIGLQKEILELFLSYNPLWLRIGLETVYGETIPLHSNNDLVGLTRFIITRFFSDPFIVKTHSHTTIASLKLTTFTAHMNKFILKKFLLLVYFLDYAKRNKLIGHDPCLFHKRAAYKDSRAILLTFAREVLRGMGDLTKVLRSHGYVVSHKQTYLDEYDYAVKEISTDLRDGVRLCRVMELITGDKNLTCRCRVPAISRLQKVHNADVALTALLQCGYTLTGDIDAKSVADGHREKTLSLLWQIIYKYQAPRFEKAAKSIQQWWRSKLWYIRVRNFLRNRREEAASRIQRAWKCWRARRELKELREERTRKWAERKEAVLVIQMRWRRRMEMMRIRKNFIAKREAAVCLQRFIRRRRETKPFVDELRVKRQAVTTIQNHWRALIVGRRERKNYLDLVVASEKIQTWWRARLAGRKAWNRYRSIRRATMIIQSRWRALRSMKVTRESFRKSLYSIQTIQSWWRRYLALKRDRNAYLLKKYAVRTIEAWWVNWKIAKIEKEHFRIKRQCAVTIQRNWRKYIETRNYVAHFRNSAKASRIIQRWWRSVRIMKQYRRERKSCVTIQRWWRSIVLMKSESKSFAIARSAAITIQKTWRMKITRRNYLRTRKAISEIQSWYRNVRVSRGIRRDFVKKRDAICRLQIWWRSLQIGKKRRAEYLEYRTMVIAMQTKWRAIIFGRKVRLNYLATRESITKIQATWRMIRTRRIYVELLKRQRAAVIVQRRWREILNARKVRKAFIEYRLACVVIQNRYRDLRITRQTRMNYLRKREAIIVFQKNWRMLRTLRRYKEQKRAAVILQTRWRARKLCIVTRENFMAIRNSTIKMQRRYRSKKIGLLIRQEYLTLRSAVLKMQARFRANKLCRSNRCEYVETRKKIIRIQRLWRTKLENRMRDEAAINIQTWWKSILAMRACKKAYEKQKSAIIVIQRRYRAYKIGTETRRDYLRIIRATLTIQRRWRYLERKKLHEQWLLDCKSAVLIIEDWWTVVLREKREREAKLAILRRETKAATKIQSIWRGYKVRTSQCDILKELRQRSERAAKAAVPSATVAVQLRGYMDMLLVCDTIGQLSMCLANIDTLTRLSLKGCIAFCELNLVDKIYSTLAKSNRSIPWMDVCLRCTSILITLAKLPDTRKYVYRVECIETLARLMTITIDHHVKLFLHLATLMWLLSENPHYANAITSCPRTTWLLSNLHATISKKKSRLSVGNMNKSRGKEQTAPLPNTKPDWGLRHNRPRLFTTVHHAISSLIKRLKIDSAT